MLNTKDIKGGGPAGPDKGLKPGNHQCKINGLSFEEPSYKAGALQVTLHLEGPDLGPDFVGFPVNKDQPELGNHKGATGRVKASEWAYADGTTKTGVEISRDQEILKFLKTLCMALGSKALKWLEDQDNKHDTIQSLLSAFNNDQPYKDTYLNFCIGGKEYKNKQGYLAYDLFLPKFSKIGVPFEMLGTKPSKLLKYNDNDFLKKLKVTDVQEFGGGSEGTLSDQSKQDFQL